jgi:succinate dehydrogenase / fumarate reductase, cytochrome b subunit
MSKLRLLYASTVGKKVIMAVSGLVWVGFLLAHMAANLLMFAGAEKMNGYAVGLREMPPLLWGARIVLIVSIVAHVVTALQLQRIKNAARPTAYKLRKDVQAPKSSRTMIWTGALIGVFLLIHLGQLTWGFIHPDFTHLQPYENTIELMRKSFWALFYAVVLVFVGFHVVHGTWSMFQSVGLNSAQHSPGLRRLTRIATLLIVLGFLSIVVAVGAGAIG